MAAQIFWIAVLACCTTTAMSTSTVAVISTNPIGNCPEFYDPDHQVYLPHSDCTKYYICTWEGVALEQSCPPNLHWNQHLSYCDYPAQAGCSSINTTLQPTSTTESTSGVPPTTSTTAPSVNCPTVDDPNHQIYFQHSTDCSKFLTCHWGSLVELSCPSGTYWNDVIKACDLQANVVCSPQPEPTTTVPVTTTTELPTTTTTTAAPSTNPSGKCPDFYDPDHQVYLPHADCTKYYICTWGGVALEQSCPPNLHWNQILSYCDYPAQAGCSTVSTTSQPTSVTTSTSESTTTALTTTTTESTTVVPSTTSTTTPSGNCPAVGDPNHQLYFPHPTDCSKFLTCHWGNLVELSCPSGTFWHDAVKSCDQQGNVVCSR